MNIVVNINKNKTDNHQPKIHDLGQITTSLQDLLDTSTIIIDSYQPILLKITNESDEISFYLLNLKDYVGDNIYGLGKDITEDNLIKITGESGSSSSGDFIPLSGTEKGKTINGNFEVDENGNMEFYTNAGADITHSSIYMDNGSVEIEAYSENDIKKGHVEITSENIYIYTDDQDSVIQTLLTINSSGIQATTNGFSFIATNGNDITTKQYVDDQFNAENLGNYINDNLSIKLTPNSDDEIVILDSLTGEAVTAKFSSFVDNYSTTETKTGGTWIDGKPIYSKSIIYYYDGLNSQPFEVEHEIENFSELVGGEITLKTFPPTKRKTLSFSSNNDLGEIYVNNTIIYVENPSQPDTLDLVFTLNYTKTTD